MPQQHTTRSQGESRFVKQTGIRITLQQIHHAIEENRLPTEYAMALLPTIDSWKRSIEELETTLSITRPTQGYGKTKLSSHRLVVFGTRGKSKKS
jgi:hypothetical protein